jgi:hypothetical protein
VNTLVKSTTEAMKEMILLLKENKNSNVNATNEEKKRDNKNGKDIMTHQSASIVARNIHQKLKMNVGN